MPQPAWPPRDASHLLVSSAQMAALEEQLFASGLPVEALMEKAALAVARRLQQPDWWPQLQQRGALVLVGPGHNGGDGLVVARELQLAGIAVRLWSPFERRKPLTDAHWRHARWLGVAALEQAPPPDDPALWIDALFGIGQRRPLDAALAALLGERQRIAPGRLIAIDVPSGLCADSGRPLPPGDGQTGTAACAALTCCIGLIKQGLVQDTALAWVGQLERIELGLPPALLAALPPRQPLLLQATDAAQAPWPALPPAAHKYGRGRLLVVAGSDAYRGAAHLCLQGASASGCGSLRAALPRSVAEQLWQAMPHVVVSGSLASSSSGGLSLADLPAEALERLDAVVLGPGLGPGAGAGGEAAAWALLQGTAALLVLDADGLNRLAARGDAAAWLRQRGGPTWITPHAGEFARLFPELTGLMPLEAVARAAEQSGCSVLLKGARSMVAAADGRRWQLGQAQPAAARAGLGDVLAGYCAGRAAAARAAGGPADGALLAAAVLEHALAGERAAAQRGAGGATPLAVANALQPHTIEY
ncbi:MAG: NAD(P)H-hydrate dehydratase [Vulcanococcus sp.]